MSRIFSKILFCFLLIHCVLGLINIELTILQYDNPLGTSYTRQDTQGDRKCCDVGGATCMTGNDTCDVFFTFCIGRWSNDSSTPGCIGYSIDMSQDVSNNVYSIKTGKMTGLTKYGNLTHWIVNQTSVIVQVLDLDMLAGGRVPSTDADLIDNFIEPLTFRPSPSYWASPKHHIHLQQHSSLDLQIRLWCADGWYGDTCDMFCNHDDYHICSEGTPVPLLQCSDMDMLVLSIMKPVADIPSLAILQRQLYGFLADFVCPNRTTNLTLNLETFQSHSISQTDALFHGYCDGVKVSRLKFQEMIYVFDVVTSRLPPLNALFGVPLKQPGIKFISASSSTASISILIRIIYYENLLSKNNCNRGTQGAYCNPRLTMDFQGINGVLGHLNVYKADKFVDCNGAAVDTNDRNTTQVDNSTILFILAKYPDVIRIRVSDLKHSADTVAVYGLNTTHTTVGTNFIDAMPHVYKAINQGTKISVEVMAWCSNCHYGDKCQYVVPNCQRGITLIPPTCKRTSDCSHGMCINSSCVCDGWVGPTCNIDIDECTLGYCQHSTSCINTPGNYSCTCQPGFTGRNCDTDLDECQSDPCSGGSVCLNTYGSYSCICSNGTQSQHCFIDSCVSTPCNNNAACTNNGDGTFNCTCLPGWSGSLCDHNDDECLNVSTCLNGGVCHDTPGSFYCDCPSNFTGVNCESDVNECNQQNTCDNNGICINIHGGFNCLCLPQWTGLTCEDDVDECQTELNSCFKGECINTNGSFHCVCYRGWTGENCTQDIDECHVNSNSPCIHNGTCINNQGSFQCLCPQTWTGAHCQLDVDECDTDITACSMNGNCTNTINGYSCSCLAGWSGDHCDVDVDECFLTDLCNNNGNCTNIPGGYKCDCPVNWTGVDCDTDFDECVTSPCKNGGTCQNIQGSFTCVCPSNWTGSVCDVDVDECQGQSSPCVHGNCINSKGGYSCVCPPQWTGTRCENDNNECSVFSPCQNSGTCTDTVGGYMCTCPSVWTGTNCTDNVDECIVYPDICEHGSCTDVIGDYRCTCKQGYTGKNCSSDINECLDLIPCQNHGVCINSVGSYSCNCSSSWTGPVCDHDVDECQDAQICTSHGSCNNSPGSFSCQCDAGWMGSLCTLDEDECGKNPCLRGNCTNSLGSYTCTCNPGWKGDNCQTNIDDCVGINCSRHGVCVDLINDYQCKCVFGYSGEQCSIDIDECGQQPCSNGGVCSDHEGYHQCACPAGWNGTNCELDIDECKINTCKTTEVCVNTQGSYSCNPVHFNQHSSTIKSIVTQSPTRDTQTRGHVTQHVEQGKSEKQSSGLPVVPIAGGAAGGVVVVIVIIIIVVIVNRKKAHTNEPTRDFQNVEVNEIEDMDGQATLTFGNPTYNTLYREHTSI